MEDTMSRLQKEERLDIRSLEGRQRLAKMIIRLFDHWYLDSR
jgi:hypothetical protein